MRKHAEIPDAWQTKFQLYLKIPFPFTWLLIGGVMFAFAWAVAYRLGLSDTAIRFFGFQALLIASIGNGVVYFEQLLDESADAMEKLVDDKTLAREWTDGWYNTIFWSKSNVVMGFCLATLTTVSGLFTLTTQFNSWPGIVCASVFNFSVGLLGGSMMWAMIGIARLMLSLGKDISITASIFDTSTSPIRSASTLLWKVSLTAILIYLLGMSIYFFCSIELQLFNVLLSAFFGLFLVLYFVLPQVNIHKTLVRIKGERLSALVGQIDKSFDTVTQDPNPQNIAQLRELFDIQSVVNGKRSWAFGTNELLLLIGSIAIPLLLFLVGRLFAK